MTKLKNEKCAQKFAHTITKAIDMTEAPLQKKVARLRNQDNKASVWVTFQIEVFDKLPKDHFGHPSHR
jgi:hypothetical protein